MSSDSVPPSIPPRKRPVKPSSHPTAKSSGSAKAADPQEGTAAAKSQPTTPTTSKEAPVPTEARTAPASTPRTSASARPATSPRPATAKAEADGAAHAPGAAYAPTATREPVGSNGAASSTHSSGTDVPGGTDESEEPPSPLQVAVDSVTASLKKAASATSAAISSAKHPRPKDDTMSPSSSAANDHSESGAFLAAGTATATDAPPRPSTGARPSAGRPATIPAPGAPRRVRLAVSRVDPWSVMKLSFLLSVAIGIMIVVAAAVVWFTLDGLSVFAQVDTLVKEVLGAESDVNVLQYVEFQRIISAATLVAVVDVFLLTALSTIGAFLYNITASLVGGVHLTLTDE